MMKIKKLELIVVTLIILLAFFSAFSEANDVRIKDVSRVKGFTENQLTGMGLVIGLNGTGDGNQIRFTSQQIANMLNAAGIKHDASAIRTRNVAAVSLSAILPPFARRGSKIDVTVSSMGDAASLQGGVLVVSELKALNGDVYATAQGPVFVGGYSIGGSGTAITQNVPTAGIISGGGIVQNEVLMPGMQTKRNVTLVLDRFDFTTASNMASKINQTFGDNLASCLDGGSVDVIIPSRFKGQVIGFIAALEGISIATDQKATVVINERTGTVVIGQDVKINTVAIAHGNLTITVSTDYLASQPGPFSGGETAILPETTLTVDQGAGADGNPVPLTVLPETSTIGEIVAALNKLGVAPRDIMSILQALKAQGALHADLKVM
jgi:flagellar P-ring protein precursor FlgI